MKEGRFKMWIDGACWRSLQVPLLNNSALMEERGAAGTVLHGESVHVIFMKLNFLT